MRNPALVEVAGPLAGLRAGFDGRLEMVGYSRQVRAIHLRLMAHLSGWLADRGLDGSAVCAPLLKEFIADRRAGGYGDGLSLRALQPLVEYLREIGIVSLRGPGHTHGPVESFLAGYAVYLARERGLASVTIRRDTDLVRPFLTGRIRGGRLDLETLTAADVTAFILACRQSVAPATVQRAATALRSLLRFLHLRGTTGSSLVGAVPAAAGWKLSGLPKYLMPTSA